MDFFINFSHVLNPEELIPWDILEITGIKTGERYNICPMSLIDIPRKNGQAYLMSGTRLNILFHPW